MLVELTILLAAEFAPRLDAAISAATAAQQSDDAVLDDAVLDEPVEAEQEERPKPASAVPS